MYYGDDGLNGEVGDSEWHGEEGEEEEEEDEGSRELTYEEIWDDSALIDAWNAATEEYEVWFSLL